MYFEELWWAGAKYFIPFNSQPIRLLVFPFQLQEQLSSEIWNTYWRWHVESGKVKSQRCIGHMPKPRHICLYHGQPLKWRKRLNSKCASDMSTVN